MHGLEKIQIWIDVYREEDNAIMNNVFTILTSGSPCTLCRAFFVIEAGYIPMRV
jgi:hypothetical protein